jgi:3-oxoacyl-[acyl-carrier protein] reductase
MTKTWALEEAGNGITVNAVGPGPIDTDMLRAVQPVGSPEREAYIKTIPVGRVGAPDDIANAVSFFLDRRSGFVTGQVLFVCGGLTVGKANAT